MQAIQDEFDKSEEATIDSDDDTVVMQEPRIKPLEPLRKLPELRMP